MKYLGVVLDKCLSYKQHVKRAADKAIKTVAALEKIMPNVGGPSSSKRRLLSTVAHSVMLYAAPVWAGALSVGVTRQHMAKVQRRMALRVTSAYKTASLDAILVIAGIPPIELQVAERKEIQEGQDRKSARERLLEKWQSRWENAQNGRWTYKMIPQIEPWINRKHGETEYYMTQVLSGHGSFRNYLYRIEKTPDDECIYCGEQDGPEHTVFTCPMWQEERRRITIELGEEELRAESMIGLMLRTPGNWELVAEYLKKIMKRKEEEEAQEYDPT